jgi:hypothetical protein
LPSREKKETKASHTQDMELHGASPVAGRMSNSSSDRQAMAQLAKTVKLMQGKIKGLEEDKAGKSVCVCVCCMCV